MVARFTGWVIFIFWMVSMCWLMMHDVIPAWTAQDPPRVVAADWVERYGKESQYGIFDDHGFRIGGIWTTYASGAATDREDEIYLKRLPLIGPMHLWVRSIYDLDGALDELDMAILGDWSPIRIKGEQFGEKFAVHIDAGAIKHRQVFKLERSGAGMISGAIRPFDAMPDLTEGQSWRMQVMNPVAAVTGVGSKFIPMLVKVVGSETIEVEGVLRDCFIVEADRVRAWVDATNGKVWSQEIRLPFGTYTVRLETYDKTMLEGAARAFERYSTTGVWRD